MGIFKAAKDSAVAGLKDVANFAVGTAAQLGSDAFAEYFNCDNMTEKTLMMPGEQISRKVGNTGKKANTNGTANVISNGSLFDVRVGQCAILVENGKVHDCVIAESEENSGQYQFRTDKEPSWVGLGDEPEGLQVVKEQGVMSKLGNVAKTVWDQYKHRLAYGGQSTNTMSLFYINMKPVLNLPVGAGNIQVRDRNINQTIMLGVHGTTTIKIANPVYFYENFITNPSVPFTTDTDAGKQFIGNIRTLIMSKLKSIVKAFVEKSDTEWWDFTDHQDEINDAIQTVLGEELFTKYGVVVFQAALECEINADQLEQLQKFDAMARTGGDINILRGQMATAQAEAMVAAANNKGGTMVGLAGLNGMMATGGNMMGMYGVPQQAPYQQPMQQQYQQPMQQAPYQQPMQQQPVQQQPAPQPTANSWTCECGTVNVTNFCGGCGKSKPAPAPAPNTSSWTCASCGNTNTTKFCVVCGKPRPEDNSWVCACGAKNTTKFCTECGKPMPDSTAVTAAPIEHSYRCSNCGFTPADPKNPPKFCPSCGNVFDENDIV